MTDVAVEKRARPRGWVKPRGLDRPIVGIVGLDPAFPDGPGKSGLCVLPVPSLKPDAKMQWRQGIADEAAFKWLGEACAALARPGERLLFVAEMDAFGPSIARGLGMTVGRIEGLLLDLHAIEPGSRVDVSQATWRKATLRKRPKGRDALKKAAVREVLLRYGVTMPTDAAESTLIATWALEQMGSE